MPELRRAACVIAAGVLTSRRASMPSQFSARKLPRCGVEMKITRVTNGSGSKNIALLSSARVSLLNFDLVERPRR